MSLRFLFAAAGGGFHLGIVKNDKQIGVRDSGDERTSVESDDHSVEHEFVVSDDQLVECLSHRGALRAKGFIEVLFINACGSLDVCRRLRGLQSVPVLLGWADEQAPSVMCAQLVGRICCPSQDLGRQ